MIEKLRKHFSTLDTAEIVWFWVLATLEVVTVVATYLIPPLAVFALMKYLLF